MPRRGFLLVTALWILRANAASAACLALRPTSVDADWSYGGAPVNAFDTLEGNVRVWYATQGEHAPPGGGGPETPAAVREAGDAAEAALARFDALGFRRPRSDAASPCLDHGGDGRLDLYLFDFKAADGTIVVDSCEPGVPETCGGFAIVENDFANTAYASRAEGFRTVVPHELFHLVQQAYASNDEAWWSEGSAQWAAQQVYPELEDLERFLPAFFAHPERALDFPAVGAAADISYGAAIWPIFLRERFELDTPRQVFEALGAGAPTVLAATATVLDGWGRELGSTFAEFARWNGATGSRAGAGGYVAARDYPEVALEPLGDDVPSEVAGTLAGLAARYFVVESRTRRTLSLAGSAGRVGAWLVPFAENGRALLASAAELPTTSDAPGIIVVSGLTTERRDVRFRLRADEPAVEPEPNAGGAGGAAAPDAASVAPDGGGCSLASPASDRARALYGSLGALAALALSFARRLDRRSA